MTNVYPLYI